MNSPSQVIRQLLLNFALGEETEGDWTIFTSFLPDTPDLAICVYDTAGRFDGRIMRGGEWIERPGVQVRVRGVTYKETWEKTNAIALSLDTVRKSVVTTEEEDYIVHNVSRTGAIIPLGIEETSKGRRHHFTINMLLTLQRLSEPFHVALGGQGSSLLLSGQSV